ncbi:MAG: MraY family glycosyltransferase, partial [Nitrospinota bacterium]|nr:MraY family glycosyltransferase [Nitrospinota bacterium]
MKFESLPIPSEIFIIGYLLAFIISFAITLFLIRFPINSSSNQIAKKIKAFGGISVISAFLTTLWFFQLTGLIDPGHIQLISIISLSTGLMMLLGIYDDIFNCSARLKLIIQTIIACILYYYGFQIERIGDLIELGNFSILLTVLWIVGITNAINLVDGMDGLAPGIIFFSCLTIVFVYLDRQIIGATFFAVILAGSVLGFFIFNFPPAKIILGDTGSLPLGLIISLIT